MTKMTLEQVRDWHRVVASENAERRALCSPNGERWELWNDEFNKQVAMADAIDAHLAKGAQDARKAFAFDALVAAGIVTQAKADESLAIADQAMLSQRGEVE
jgi:hypothetical protein